MAAESLQSTPIALSDRVHAVLARDERLIEVFTETSSAFDKLKKPALRRTMARLVTVEQAARIAKVDAKILLKQLNTALVTLGGLDAEALANLDDGEPGSADSERVAAQHAAWDSMVQRSAKKEAPAASVPEAVRTIGPELVTEADVREDLRQGREPLGQLLKSARLVPEGGVLKVWAIFEPVPLYTVLGRQGFTPYAESFAKDDWLIWFHRDGGAARAQAKSAAAGAVTSGEASGRDSSAASAVSSPDSGAASNLASKAATNTAPEGDSSADSRSADLSTASADPADQSYAEDKIRVLDVRGLEPPEPMMRTLEALAELAPDETLVQLNVRVPQFLIAELQQRGFVWEVREQSEDLFRVFIRHGGE